MNFSWGYTHDRCADKYPFPPDRSADKDSAQQECDWRSVRLN